MTSIMLKLRIANKQPVLTFRRFQSVVASSKTDHFIELEHQKSAHNYHPIPRVLSRGEGVFLWDVEGKVSYLFYIIIHQSPWLFTEIF
jgi:hypothetical protein